MNRIQLFCLVAFSCLTSVISAQSRIKQSINTGWQFYKGGGTEMTLPDNSKVNWEKINLPHSYNTQDVLDDEPGYYRGNAWYKKKIYFPASWKGKEVYIFFEGVNQTASVFLNGKPVGEHIGGYTAFRFRLNDAILFEKENELQVKVNNAFNEDIPPLTADFTFFGGIYRDVYLEAVNRVHFGMIRQYASKGVFVSTPTVAAEKASVEIKGTVVNSTNIDKDFLVTSTVFDKTGREVVRKQTNLKVKSQYEMPFLQDKISVAQPELWSPESPVLYRVVTSITDAKTKELLDEMSNPLGFRWFSFTGDKGFFLNGKPYKIWGTSRHQDFPLKANALPDVVHVNDVQLLKNMGGNFLRVAHYPQDPAVLEACDRLGILTSVEIPVVNTITESYAFTRNAMLMQREMIAQNYNHPSVIMWACMNEALLRLPFGDDKPRQEIYFKNVARLATTLDSLTRKEDPSRYTMAAFHGNYALYKRVGLIDIPQVAGWNLYQGWYSGNINGFGEFLDQHYKDFPQKPTLITEYGADGDPRVRGFSPVRFDKTVEYETYYHKVYIKAIESRPFVSGGLVWNLADFSSEARAESMPHVNNKGILNSYRNPKDAYLLYQSYLLKTPFLKIGSRSWKERSGLALSEDSLYCKQPVEVYTNINDVLTFTNNGKVVGIKKPSEGVAVVNVAFTNGINHLEVSGGGVKEEVDIQFHLQPSQLKSARLPFQHINVSLGDSRYYVDEQKQVWIPEKPYEKGSWGFVGGETFVPANKGKQQYGSDKNILGTDDDPVYETQRVGIEQFKLDVPDGQYELTLHFAELLGGELREALVYNLGNGELPSRSAPRRNFDVLVNGTRVIEGLSGSNYLVPETAYSTKAEVTVVNGSGIVIDFKPFEGKTILNGLQVRRVY